MTLSAVVSHRNITDRIRVEQELARLAATDTLTGLPNRRFFEEVANAELHQVQRFHKPASLMMIDIDKFKSIDDTLGHAAGDDVLRAVASLSKDIVHGDDLYFRFGGEEFVFLLRETDERGAIAMAEWLRPVIEKLQIASALAIIPVTASFGVACITAADSSIDSILARADKALHRAKVDERNCIRSSSF